MEKNKIGTNAGLIWQKLEEKGMLPMHELARQLTLGADDVALAVGWLAREDKVHIERRNGVLYIKLN